MTEEKIFHTDSVFKSVTQDNEVKSWLLTFNDNISLYVQTWWRLLEENRVVLTSEDSGHFFGSEEPVNVSDVLTQKLSGKYLKEVKIKKGTGDLYLTVDNNLQVEVLICSCGYESYNLVIKGKTIIGGGSGEITMFDNPIPAVL